MVRLLGMLIVLGVLLVACGGGSGEGERVLRLGGGDFTEAEFRLDMRVALSDATLVRDLCTAIQGLSDEETAELIVELQEQQSIELVQEADPNDRLRAAAIVQEECERLTSPP